MAKISIIIPVFNTAAYLEQTLQCLCQQTFSDLEILVADDGSTDDSAAIVKRMQKHDSRISYFFQPNKGQSAARNLVLQYATGEYIYFMDSDDLIAPDAMQQCYDYIERTKADFIFFDGDIMYEDGSNNLSWNYKRTQLFPENTRYQGEALLNQVLDAVKHNCVVWLLFIRHSYLKDIRLKFYEGIIHEDELFTVKLTLQSDNIFCLQRSFVTHRVRHSSTMGISYSERNINCYLTVIDELLRFQDTPIIHKYARYTLDKVFFTGHLIPFSQKPAIFLRAVRSGYLKFISKKSITVFWLKQR